MTATPPETTAGRPRGVAWGGAANLVGGVLGAGINLVLAAVVGRHLGTTGAGTYFLVVAVFMIVANVVELGADTGLVRFLAAARATGREHEVPTYVLTALRPVIATGLVVVGVIAALSGPIASAAPGLSPAFVTVAAVVAVMTSLAAVVLAASRGLGDVLSYPLVQSVALPLLRVVGIGVVVMAGAGVVTVLLAWLAPLPLVLLLAAGVLVRLVVRIAGTLRPTGDVRPGLRREFWSFSLVRGVSATVEILIEWVDVLLVGALASPAEAGIYAIVTRCARAGEVVQQAARVAVGPQISSALARRSLDEARHLYGLVSAAMIWLAWPFYCLLAIFGDAVLSIFGAEFSQGHTALVVLTAAMGVATAAGTVQSILLMGGRSSWQLADKSLALTTNVLLDLALIPLWGIEGAAVAWAAAIAIDTALVVWQVQGLMGIHPPYAPLLATSSLALGVVGIGGLAFRLALGSSLGTFGFATAVLAVTYLALSWWWRDRLGLVALARLRSS